MTDLPSQELTKWLEKKMKVEKKKAKNIILQLLITILIKTAGVKGQLKGANTKVLLRLIF